MLRKESATVRHYLERAVNARQRAAAAVDETTQKFHQSMECKWMDLSASTAGRRACGLVPLNQGTLPPFVSV